MKLKLTAIAGLLLMLGACKKSDTNSPITLTPVASKVSVKYNATDSNYSTMTWDANHRVSVLNQTNVAGGSSTSAVLTYSRNSSGTITSWTAAFSGVTLSAVTHVNSSGSYSSRVYYYFGFAYDSLAFTYSSGRVSEAIEYSNSGTYTPAYRVLYTYDASGNLLTQETYTYGSGWTLTDRKTYTYDTNVNPIPFGAEMLLSAAVGVGTDNVIGVGPNNPLSLVNENISGGTTTTTTYVYTYNSSNMPLTAVGTVTGGATTVTTYTY
jgi:hypothetical protein